jgi:hypothetical protein
MRGASLVQPSMARSEIASDQRICGASCLVVDRIRYDRGKGRVS